MIYITQAQAKTVYSEALNKAIELRCVSIAKLSKRIGVRSETIHAYRRGVAYPSKRVNLSLCEVLGFDLPYYGQGVRRVGRFKNVAK